MCSEICITCIIIIFVALAKDLYFVKIIGNPNRFSRFLFVILS